MGAITPSTATERRRRADCRHLADVGFEPDLEQQEQHADLRERPTTGWALSASNP